MFFSLLLLPVALAIEQEEEIPVEVGSTKFWCQIVAIVCLVLLSGVIAGKQIDYDHTLKKNILGLTLGLVRYIE